MNQCLIRIKDSNYQRLFSWKGPNQKFIHQSLLHNIPYSSVPWSFYTARIITKDDSLKKSLDAEKLSGFLRCRRWRTEGCCSRLNSLSSSKLKPVPNETALLQGSGCTLESHACLLCVQIREIKQQLKLEGNGSPRLKQYRRFKQQPTSRINWDFLHIFDVFIDSQPSGWIYAGVGVQPVPFSATLLLYSTCDVHLQHL